MPLDLQNSPLAGKVTDWNAQAEGLHPVEIVRLILTEPSLGRMAAVSSFGAESVVLLHMIAQVAPGLPILFLDTGKLFPETLDYKQSVTDTLGLMDVRTIRPDREELFARDPDGILHIMNPDACCALRKVEPLQNALSEFGGWLTGRKRYQGGSRSNLAVFEIENASGRLKVNPLAAWDRDQIEHYIAKHHLPRHPLAGRNMPSLGCLPCTSQIAEGEDIRAGRWRGELKVECGIHFENGQAVRAS